MPSLQSNVKELKGYLKTAPKTNKTKIQDVIDHYIEKKIKSFNKAQTAVMFLASKNKETIKSGRAIKEYNKLVGAAKKVEEEAAKKVEKKKVAAMKIRKFSETL